LNVVLHLNVKNKTKLYLQQQPLLQMLSKCSVDGEIFITNKILL